MLHTKGKREEFANDYNPEVQKIFLSLFVADPDLFAKCRTIIKDEYFDDAFRPAVRFILDYADTYRSIPGVPLIEAKTGIGLTAMDAKELGPHKDWFCKDFEGFCRYRAMENAILDGVDLLREGRADEVQTRVKDALTIRLMSDLGTDYFENPEQRLRRMLENTVTVPTGWKLLDDKLFGGLARGGLHLFLGNSGAGKSLVLQNLALNWALEGHNGIYFTLELHEEHTALKLDAMITGRGTRDIVREVSDSALLVKMRGKKAGNLKIKKYPEGGTTCNDLRAYLKEYEIINGHAPDFILIDYLDLLFPNDKRIDPSNLFIKDKFVSEEIRALMHETNTFGATASQLTRGSIEAMGEFDQSHTAGGISKINTADTAIAIYAPPSHKERGEFDMIFLKTRASSGVGQRIKLGYDNTSMRITDPTLTIGEVEHGSSYEDLRQELQKDSPTIIAPDAESSQRKLGKLEDLMAKRRA